MGEDEYSTSDILVSEDEEEHNVFIALSRAAQPRAPASSWDDDEESTPAFPSPSSDMLVCKHTAVWLGILWPVIVVETTRSHYEGKKLPLARSATKQLLPIFSELLADSVLMERPSSQQQEPDLRSLFPRLQVDGELGSVQNASCGSTRRGPSSASADSAFQEP